MAEDTNCTPCPDGSPCGSPTIVAAGKYASLKDINNCDEALSPLANSVLVHGEGDKPVKWGDGSSSAPIKLNLQGEKGDSVMALVAIRPDGTVQQLIGDDTVGLQEIIVEGSSMYIKPLGSTRTCFDRDEIPVATEEELTCVTKLGLTGCGQERCLVEIPELEPPFYLPAGSIIMYGGVTAPNEYWTFCNGTPLDPVAEPQLFEAIGYNYGRDGDLFRVPDFRGVFPRGVDNGKGMDPEASSRVASNTGGATGDSPGSFQDHAQKKTQRRGFFGFSVANANSGTGAGIQYVWNIFNITKDFFLNSGDPYVRQLNVDNYVDDNDANLSDNENRPMNLYVNFLISLGRP